MVPKLGYMLESKRELKKLLLPAFGSRASDVIDLGHDQDIRIFLFFLIEVLGIEPRTCCMLSGSTYH